MGANNASTAPSFVAQYFNTNRGVTYTNDAGTTGIDPAPAFDEGGNFIRPRFGPLTLFNPVGGATPPVIGSSFGNYHLTAPGTSGQGLVAAFLAEVAPVPADLGFDYDRDSRPSVLLPTHRGADQVVTPVPTTTPLPRTKQ